jgi:hypothetical protein
MAKILETNTTNKLTNINSNTDGKFQSVDCGELYRWNSPLICFSVNTNENIPSVYRGNYSGKRRNKKKSQKLQ